MMAQPIKHHLLCIKSGGGNFRMSSQPSATITLSMLPCHHCSSFSVVGPPTVHVLGDGNLVPGVMMLKYWDFKEVSLSGRSPGAVKELR